MLVTFLTVIPAGAVAIAIGALKLLQRDSRRDPLTSELLALPGARAQQQLSKQEEDGLTSYMSGVVICAAIGNLILVRHVAADLSALNTFDYLLIATSFLVGGWTCYKLIRASRARRKYYQGLRAEIATAQEIYATLAGNYRLLNDLECDGFNIDHAVVTPAGVFAIETKSRRKLAQGNGSPKVFYDGKALKFPGWSETVPLAQAARQAQWLRNYLQKATGASFPVQAALALPGWYVENTARMGASDVRVFNPKKSGRLFTPSGTAVLTDAQIQQAVFALEKLAKAPEL